MDNENTICNQPNDKATITRPMYKLYLKHNENNTVQTIELDVYTDPTTVPIHSFDRYNPNYGYTSNVPNNERWVESDLFDYDKIVKDPEELLKLYYFLDFKDDFNSLLVDELTPSTKKFLIETAINFRDDGMIKFYLDDLSIEQLNKHEYNISPRKLGMGHQSRETTNMNILEKLALHGITYSEDNTYYSKRNYPTEDDDLVNIVEYICQKKPELITPHAMSNAMHNSGNRVYTLFRKYNLINPIYI
jgi:hypothetical protein